MSTAIDLVARTLAAVHVKDLTGHEPRRFQIEDRTDDILDFAHVADWVQSVQLRMSFHEDLLAF